MFRDLRADEIECRVGTQTDKGISLLLYKDARCDMNILDETVGALNWQRSHCRDNANCIVSIWDPDKEQWISKEDTGTESKTEAEKGLASDSFKRACFNFGIGRELYTAPFIWIQRGKYSESSGSGKPRITDKFTVADIKIEHKTITRLVIKNAKGAIVYSFGSGAKASAPAAAPEPKEADAAVDDMAEKKPLIDKILQLDCSIQDIYPDSGIDYVMYCYEKMHISGDKGMEELTVHQLEMIGKMMETLYIKAKTKEGGNENA